MTTQLSGSRLPIARHCGYAFRSDVDLPKYQLGQDDADAAAGRSKHEYLLTYVETGVFPPLTPGQKIIAEQFKRWWGERGQWTVEHAIMLNPRAGSARNLGTHIDRDYGTPESGELPLTIDYEGMLNGVLCVGDIKTGFATHVEHPQTNLQLHAGAIAAGMLNAAGNSEPFSALLEIPHVTEEGVYCRDWIMTPGALMEALNEIIAIQAQVPTSTPRVGEHCRWCDIKGSCPAQAELAARVLDDRNGRAMLAKWSTEFVSQENERLLVEEIAALKKALESVEEALKKRAGRGGIDMGDGTVYRAVVSRAARQDKKMVEALLGDRLAECTKIVEYEQFRRVKL